MRIENFEVISGWNRVIECCEATSGKPVTDTDELRYKLLISEHSPIRALMLKWKWCDIPYWVSVHLVRHKVGIEHFVRSQRKTRSEESTQYELVDHLCIANAQAVINMASARLCGCTAVETRQAVGMLVDAITNDYRLNWLGAVLAPKCVRIGGYFCPEELTVGLCGIGKNYFGEYVSKGFPWKK